MIDSFYFLWTYLKRIKIYAFTYFFLSVLHKITIIFIPMITKNLIDEAVKGNNLEQLMNNALYFLVATLLFILFLSLKYYFQNFIEINVINSLKQDMIKKINNIEYGELLKKDLGYFTQRINKDIDKIKI